MSETRIQEAIKAAICRTPPVVPRHSDAGPVVQAGPQARH